MGGDAGSLIAPHIAMLDDGEHHPATAAQALRAPDWVQAVQWKPSVVVVARSACCLGSIGVNPRHSKRKKQNQNAARDCMRPSSRAILNMISTLLPCARQQAAARSIAGPSGRLVACRAAPVHLTTAAALDSMHPRISPELPLFYNDVYRVDLPVGHRFPMEKYRLVREVRFCDWIRGGGCNKIPYPPGPLLQDSIAPQCAEWRCRK